MNGEAKSTDTDTNDEMMTCQEMVALVSDYLDGELDPADRQRFEAHIHMCPGCLNHVEQMRNTRLVVGALTEQNAPPESLDTLLDAFRDWKKPH